MHIEVMFFIEEYPAQVLAVPPQFIRVTNIRCINPCSRRKNLINPVHIHFILKDVRPWKKCSINGKFA
jgi:hypothetical protein